MPTLRAQPLHRPDLDCRIVGLALPINPLGYMHSSRVE